MESYSLIYRMLMVILMLSLPVIGAISLAAIILGILQSIMQIQDQTVQLLVKLVIFGVVMMMSGSWMLSVAVDFLRQNFGMIS